MTGRQLGGRYELGRQIGDGGMAVVYEAVDRLLDRRVAVKILRPEFANDDQFLRRFSREARAAARLCHPNIVQVYDVGRDGGVDYIVMEYVEGRTLKDKIQEEAPLKPSVAVNLARQVLEALRHAHQHGVVHRDIKPQNILLTPTGQVKVTDFGIARAVGGATMADTEIVMGTAHYLSPEQAKGRFTGAQSDLYSLGVVLYEMLTGKLPFDGDTAVTVAVKHLQEQPPPLRSLNDRVPPALELIVERALAKDTARRYASADEFLADLARYRTRNLDELIAAQKDRGRTLVLAPLSGGADGADAAALEEPLDEDREETVGDQANPRRRLARWLPWVAALLVLAAGAYAGISYLMSWLRPAMIRVPPLVGATLEAAQESLAPYRITVHVLTTRYDNQYAAGVVIDQSPAPGELVRLGSRIDVIVSRGPEFVEGGVPDVRGLLERAAVLELERAGLQVEVAHEHNALVPAGRVADQNPAPGTRVVVGTSVRLTVSQGPEPASVTLPNFIGRPYEEVRRVVQQLGLEIGTIETQFSDYPREYVRSQSPEPGTVVRPGDKINLVLSQGNGLVPNETVLPLQLPDRPAQQRVEVRVRDRSERVVHIGEHQGGDRFNATVQWYGEQAEVFVYVNGQLYDHVILQLGGEDQMGGEEVEGG